MVIQSAINSLGTVVIAASSAAYSIEIFVYYVFNSFSQACIASIALILFSGKFLLSLFNSDPQVIAIGYTRLVIVFTAYIFSMLYEVMSGYLRGFGISLVPAILTIIGVCAVRITWVYAVFPLNRTFHTLMLAYPVSLCTTALLIFIALCIYRPSRRFR